MGQDVPTNYGKLVSGTLLARRVGFDPAAESVHGLLSEGSRNREESEQDDQPMGNPYEQPHRHAEAADPGSLQNREAPDDQWEQQRSSPGNPDQEDPRVTSTPANSDFPTGDDEQQETAYMS